MYKYILSLCFVAFTFFSCKHEPKTSFSIEALTQPISLEDGTSTNVGDIIEQYKGDKLIIEVWASWCSDCIKSLTKVSDFQKKNPEVNFVFFSVDDDKEAWKNGLVRYMNRFNIKGEQYHFDKGWGKGNYTNDFIEYIDLDWIPRYMLIDADGKILVDYAKSIDDKNILENL